MKLWRARGSREGNCRYGEMGAMAAVVLTGSRRIWNRHVPVVDVGGCRYHSVGREREIQKNAANSVRMWAGRISPACGRPHASDEFLLGVVSVQKPHFTSHIDKQAIGLLHSQSPHSVPSSHSSLSCTPTSCLLHCSSGNAKYHLRWQSIFLFHVVLPYLLAHRPESAIIVTLLCRYYSLLC